VLDAVTVRNLELIEPLFAGTDAGMTLFRSIDATVTPMGKRLLRSWLLRPSIDIAEINARLDAVESQVKATIAREELRRALDGILDLERLLSRVTLETANPRDVLALAASLAKLPAVRKALQRVVGVAAADSAAQATPSPHSERLAALHSAVDELADLRQRIENTIIPEPPIFLSDGGVIQSGVDPELDQLRDLSRNSKQFLAQIEQRERQRTGIASLKVKFNSIFGYYLEISKANSHLAPPDYERKQTLVNAERFTTPELKEYESKILDAQEKIVDIERRLFTELRSAIAGEARRIRQTALALAEVDVLAALAQVAALRNYGRPKFDDSADLEIVAVNDITDARTLAHLLKYDSVLGRLDAEVTVTDAGIVRLAFEGEELDGVLQELADRVSPRVLEVPARLDGVRRELDEYFEGRRNAFETPVDWQLSHGFHLKAREACYAIPFGSVLTYAELAAAAGSPRAVRAAGQAMARNPVPIVVPCHRVLRTGGALGGYGGGLDVKRWLLDLEHGDSLF
jgi:O-6-methylguanine DNA methyltransferase